MKQYLYLKLLVPAALLSVLATNAAMAVEVAKDGWATDTFFCQKDAFNLGVAFYGPNLGDFGQIGLYVGFNDSIRDNYRTSSEFGVAYKTRYIVTEHIYLTNVYSIYTTTGRSLEETHVERKPFQSLDMKSYPEFRWQKGSRTYGFGAGAGVRFTTKEDVRALLYPMIAYNYTF